MITRSLLAVHDVNVGGDNPWQRRARLHQSLWRQRHGFAAGTHRDKPLGSRLVLADAEWSPGRNDPRYTGNRSAFDVFIEYLGDRGRSFLTVEVEYHEDLTGTVASDPDHRYPAIAHRHQVFRDDALPQLQKLPLQQLWLDHLLALQLRACPDDGWDFGTFVLLHPVGNTACAAAAWRYRHTLTNTDTFDARTLDEVVQAVRLATADSWPVRVHERYLDPTPINAAINDVLQQTR